MDVGYHIFKMLLGGNLHEAPIPETTSRILDLGTGTGAWAIEMADRMPQSTVIGVDLSPIQPTLVPPNCHFEIFDFETEWNFSQPFDFIHARNTEGSTRDHRRLFAQSLAHLKPGGYIEAAEATVGVWCDDDTVSLAPNLIEWQNHLLEASGKFGKPMGVAGNYKTWLEEAGFVDVKENVYKLPFSAWPKSAPLKQLGRYQQVSPSPTSTSQKIC
jgi:trans-aconitate methyltransferase